MTSFRPKNLQKTLAALPASSGVYQFLDRTGTIIYVGKATSLKSRVRSYFARSAALSAAKQQMVGKIAAIHTHITQTPIEALILESQLIKKYTPRYNILMRDDKNYSFVVITKHPLPKIFVTHQPNAATLSTTRLHGMPVKEYIGPFTDGTGLQAALAALRKVFPYCTCTTAHTRPCQQAQLGNCLGVCCLKHPEHHYTAEEIAARTDQYRRNITAIKSVLKGNTKKMIALLTARMQKAADVYDFAAAATLKKQKEGLENIFTHKYTTSHFTHLPKIISQKDWELVFGDATPSAINRIECYDIANIGGKYATGSLTVWEDDNIQRSHYRYFSIKTVHQPNDPAMIAEVISRRANHWRKDARNYWPKPDLIIVDGAQTQCSAALTVLHAYGEDIPLIGIAKDPDRLYLPTEHRFIPLTSLPRPIQYAVTTLRNEAHRFSRKLHHQKMDAAVRRKIDH